MSSVTRFIRQINASNSYVGAATVAAAPATYAYEFHPSSGNVAGNYPPGFMVLTATTSGTLGEAILQAVNVAGASNLVLRDMGKTLKAPVGSLTGDIGYFRQVQLLYPKVLAAAQGELGGSNGSNNGVLGGAASPDVYTNYLTFYVAVVVGGAAYSTCVTHPLCGQL